MPFDSKLWMQSGMYIPFTGQVVMLIIPSWFEASRAFSAKL